jgi:predicted enzyme related to lactoylglutathione lyase
MITLALNRVVHLELHSTDMAQASAFYGELLGWRARRLDTQHGSYLSIELGEGIGGGIVQSPVERSLWLPYAEVADIALATEDARAAGASVLLEPREGPAGWRSVIATAAGAELALWQQKR